MFEARAVFRFINFFILIRALTLLKKIPMRSSMFNLSKTLTKKRSKRSKKILFALFSKTYPTGFLPSNVIALPESRYLALSNKCKSFSVRSLFHIKCLFDVNEYLMYDFYNFYAARSQQKQKRFKKVHYGFFAPTKLNFFYYIRRSIKIFRLHTLRFFKTSFNTERKTNLFFKSFWKMSALAYLWFFEFNIAIFLVKSGFASSVFASFMLMNSNFVLFNGNFAPLKWSVVKPGHAVNIVLTAFVLINVKYALLQYMALLKRFKKFFFRHLIRRRVVLKSTRLFKKGKKLVFTKQTHLCYIETDWRILRSTLIPFNDNSLYYSYIFARWLNYWNYKTVLWKYDT